MSVLNIIEVEHLIDNQSTDTNREQSSKFSVKAANDCHLRFHFDRKLITDETATIRCHLYEPIFQINYYLPDIQVTTPESIQEEVNKLAQLARRTAELGERTVQKAKELADRLTDAATKLKSDCEKSGFLLQLDCFKTTKERALTANLHVRDAKPKTTKALDIASDLSLAVRDTNGREVSELADDIAGKVENAISIVEETIVFAEEVVTILTEEDKRIINASPNLPTESEIEPNTNLSDTINYAIESFRAEIINTREATNELTQAAVNLRVALTNAPDNHSFTIKFPEELAGAEIRMTFYVKQKPTDLESLDTYGEKNVPSANDAPDPIGKTIEILSNQENTPQIVTAYWAEDENIAFGTLSASRNTRNCKNQTAYYHIHTRGLYGKEITVRTNHSNLVRIKNNIFVGNQLLNTVDSETMRLLVRNKSTLKTPGTIESTTSISQPTIPEIGTQTTPLPMLIRELSTDLTYITSVSIHDLLIDLENTAPIIRTSAVRAQIGNDVPPPIASDAKSRVEFRPSINYKGEFGFSWFRRGDVYNTIKTGVENEVTGFQGSVNLPSNDQDFNTTMGRHYNETATRTPRNNGQVIQNTNYASQHFDIDRQMIANHKLDYQKLVLNHMPRIEYLIPVMTIGAPFIPYGKSSPVSIVAELSVFIESREDLHKIEFEFDNPKAMEEGYLSIEQDEIKDISRRDFRRFQQTEYKIKITCHKEFSKDLMLLANAYSAADGESTKPQICGAIRILANDISRQRNIKMVFFNVTSRLDPAEAIKGFKGNSNRDQEIDTIRKYLRQAYVNLDITVEDLNLNIIPTATEVEKVLNRFIETAKKTITAVDRHNNNAIIEEIQNLVDNTPKTMEGVSALDQNIKDTLPQTGIQDRENLVNQLGENIILSENNIRRGTREDPHYLKAIHNPDYSEIDSSGNETIKKRGFTFNYNAPEYFLEFVDRRLKQEKVNGGEITLKEHYKDTFKSLFFGDLFNTPSFDNEEKPIYDPEGKQDHDLNGGFIDPTREKLMYMFSGMESESISAHEFLHSLGLAHIFDGNTNKNKYVYQLASTDNIMDYPQYMILEENEEEEEEDRGIIRSEIKNQSLFHWQMKIINNNI